MPTYRITVPGKGTYRVSSPTDLTDEQAWEAVQEQLDAPPKKASASVADLGYSALSGVGSLLQFPAQAYGLATGDFDTGLNRMGESIKEYAKEHQSEGLKQRQRAQQQAIQEADKQGVLSGYGAAISSTLKDPVLLGNFLAENVANMIPGFGVARGTMALGMRTVAAKVAEQGLEGEAKAAAIKAAQEALSKKAEGAAVGIAVGQQGADVGAQAYEDTYKKLKEQGASDEAAAAQALSLARSAGASGAVISYLSSRLPGARALEGAFAGSRGTKAAATGLLKGVLGEGISEGVEEGGGTLSRNAAMRTIDPTQDLMQGVGSSAGLGSVLGGVMGGGAGMVNSSREAAYKADEEKQQAELRALKKQLEDAAAKKRADASANEGPQLSDYQSPLTKPEGGPGRPTFLQAQQDIFGGEQANAPAAQEAVAPDVRKAELAQQIRTMQDLLEERRAVVSAATSPEESLKAAAQFRQVEAALKQATAEHDSIKIAPAPEEKLAKLYSSWQKAKETGDVDKIAHYAQRIAEMQSAGVQTPSRAMKQAEMPMKDFTGKSESRSEFFPRVNANELNQPTATDVQESGDTYVPPPPPPKPPTPLNTGRTDQLSLLDTTPQTRTVVNRGEGKMPTESRVELVAQRDSARATGNVLAEEEAQDKLDALDAYTPKASKKPGGVLAHRVSPTTSAPTVETTYTSDKAPDAEAIRTAVAQLPERLNPYYEALAARIQQNADAIASSPENASMVSGLLYQMRTNPMPGGNVRTAQLRDVTDMLDTLEQGKRSETEALPSGEVRTAVQTDMFPQQQYQGTVLASGKSFQKFLASEALQKMRSLMGIAGQTLARAMKRAEPLQRRVAALEESLQAVQDKYDRTVASFDRLDAQAQQAYEAALARLKAVRDRLDAELQPLQADYLQAQQALKEATDYARDITETMRANNMRIEGLEQLADLQNQLAQAMQQDANKAGWDHMRSLQREIATVTAKLESAFGTAGGEAATYARANTALQKRLSNELNQLGDLHAAYTQAKEALNRVAANQARRVTTKRDLAAGEAGVRAAQSGVSDVQVEARAKARTAATRAVKEEVKQTASELRQAEERLKGAGVEEVRKRAEERRAPPKSAETQSEREARDGKKRREQQAALERAEADTFVVSFEGQSKMRQLLDDAPEALEQLEFMRQEAMDEGDQKAYKSLSTRINKLKNKVDLYTDLLNGGTEAQARLVERMRKQQEKIEKLKTKLAEAETPRQRKSRRDSLTEAEKIQQNMFRALQGQRGITYNPKKPEKLETEAPVAGTRLGERDKAPVVRNAVFPGNIRTGTEESKAGENKTKTTTKATQSTLRPISKRGITAEEQAEANRIGDEIRSKPARDVEEKPVPKRAKSKAASALDDIYADETFDADSVDDTGFADVSEDTDYTRTIDEERLEWLTKLDETASAAVRDGNVQTLLKHLSENAKNPLHRELAKRLLPLVTGTKIGTKRDLKTKDGVPMEGMYHYDTNTVDINPLYMSEETVLHELLHAATVQVIERPASQRTAAQNAAVRELEGMYAAMKANPRFKDQLTTKNLAEFVAEVYTNKPLRDAMDSVGKPLSLRQRFLDIVKRILGFGENSPSGKAIDAINKIMDESQTRSMGEGPTKYTRTATTAAAQTGSKKPSLNDRITDFGLTMETMLADMRAPLVRALERLGDTNAATQALFSMRQADQSISLVTSAMANGAPVLSKDQKGLHYVQSGDSPSGMEVLAKAKDIPGKTAEERFRKATDYMLGLQAKRLGYERFGSNADRIKALMAEVDADPKLKDALEAFRKTYNQYNEALVRMVQQTGAFSKEDADAYLKYGDYVPRYRERNGQLEMAFGDMGYQRIGDIKHTPFLHSFKGGEELILPINETLLHNTMLLTNIATTNMAKRNIGYAFSAMGKDAKKMGVRSVKKGGAVPSGPTYITWKEEPRNAEDSGDRYIEVDTDGTPLDGLDAHMLVHSMEATPIVMPAIVNAMSKLNDYLRAGITRTPIYVVRQLLRDPMSAASVTGMKDGPFTAVAKTLKDYVKSFAGDATIAELNKKALIQNPLLHGSMDDLEKLTLQFGSTGSVGSVRKLLNTLDRFALNADAATRAQIWKDSKARGMSDVEAMLRVMESMNFHKRGASADIQYATRMIPFLNSSIQAINTAVATLRGKAPFEKRVNARQTFMNNMIMLGITGFAYAAYMHDADDEEEDRKYGNLPLGDRFGNIHIRIGDSMLKLPIGYAESGGLAWALGQALFEANKDNADAKRIGKALSGYVATGTPGGISLTGDSGIALPTGLKQYVEWTTNIDTRTFQPIVPQRLQNRVAEEQYTPDTPSAYVAVGQTLGLSPIKLQRLMDSLVGSVASDALTVLDNIESGEAGKPVKPEATPETTPFLRSFLQKTTREDAINNLYELAERSKKVHNTYLGIMKERPQDLQKFLTEHREEMALRSVLGGFEEAMGSAANRIRIVKAHPTMDAATKRERIKVFEDQQKQLAQNYLQAVRRVQERLSASTQ